MRLAIAAHVRSTVATRVASTSEPISVAWIPLVRDHTVVTRLPGVGDGTVVKWDRGGVGSSAVEDGSRGFRKDRESHVKRGAWEEPVDLVCPPFWGWAGTLPTRHRTRQLDRETHVDVMVWYQRESQSGG